MGKKQGQVPDWVPEVGEYVVMTADLRENCRAGTLGVVLSRINGDLGPWPVTCLFNGNLRAHLMEEHMLYRVMRLGFFDPTAQAYEWRGPVALEADLKSGMFVDTFLSGRMRVPGLVGQANGNARH